jgi:hypothetical protein
MKGMNRQMEYLQNSAWCLEQARDADSDSQRVMLTHIAETWQRLAEDAHRTDGPYTLH